MLDRAHYLKRAEIYERLAEETLDETLAAAFRTSAQNCLATAERIHELEDASSCLHRGQLKEGRVGYWIRSAEVGAPSTQFTSQGPSTVMNTTNLAWSRLMHHARRHVIEAAGPESRNTQRPRGARPRSYDGDPLRWRGGRLLCGKSSRRALARLALSGERG
jgi:hypothetical protein